MLEKRGDTYILYGEAIPLDGLLDAVMAKDDELGGQVGLTDDEAACLAQLFKGYSGRMDFSSVRFMEASAALFRYLAHSTDGDLARLAARSMGWRSDEEELERLRSLEGESGRYRAWWMDLARAVLTTEGFDDYRFGSVRRDGNGTYLYDGEKAVCYIEVSREGGDERHAVISLTLLGNPEAVDDEEGEREFEWCCFFDDEISRTDDDARILGGRLRAIDPYGGNSLIQRRYDIVYDSIGAETLALVVTSLVSMLASYPPQVLD